MNTGKQRVESVFMERQETQYCVSESASFHLLVSMQDTCAKWPYTSNLEKLLSLVMKVVRSAPMQKQLSGKNDDTLDTLSHPGFPPGLLMQRFCSVLCPASIPTGHVTAAQRCLASQLSFTR